MVYTEYMCNSRTRLVRRIGLVVSRASKDKFITITAINYHHITHHTSSHEHSFFKKMIFFGDYLLDNILNNIYWYPSVIRLAVGLCLMILLRLLAFFSSFFLILRNAFLPGSATAYK